mgnify:CR=1 FL=1
MQKRQAGFTLIELVIVIVILGILAAAALPRFSDLSTDARVAAINGLAGSLRSAASIAKATQLAKGLASNVTVSLDGQPIFMTNGFPTAETISLALSDTAGFSFNYSAATRLGFLLGGLTNCQVNYDEATGTTSYTVTVVSTAC